MVGNPPFLGGKRLLSVPRRRVRDAPSPECVRGRSRARGRPRHATGSRSRGNRIHDGKLLRAGLVATNSIRGGASRDGPAGASSRTTRIFDAWADEPWMWTVPPCGYRSSALAERTGRPRLWTALRSTSNPCRSYCSASERHFLTAQPLRREPRRRFKGDHKGRGLRHPRRDGSRVADAPDAIPNGRSNADVLRPGQNGRDVVTSIRRQVDHRLR